MTRRPQLLYVLADGAHARFVEQSAETSAFVTVHRLDGSSRLEIVRAEQRDEQAGRSFESGSTTRHGVGREDAYRRAKEAFAADVAKTLLTLFGQASEQGVVLVAPPRLLRVMRDCIGSSAPIVAELGKDLTKATDHELGKWLLPLSLAPLVLSR
ncbi:MAG TPA: host attachment protein [Caulobacteraceae bacterium]|nr:host attachment protein [Caulobacteraceae bacterium]